MLKDRTTNRSFQPGARVIVLVKEPSDFRFDSSSKNWIPATPPEYMDITEFLDVTVINAMGRTNVATITLSNNKDRYFGKAKEVRKTTQRQAQVIDYLKEVLSISEIRERNLLRREYYYELERQGKIRRADRINNKYWAVQDNGLLLPSGKIPDTRAQEYSEFEYTFLDLDLMKRVWIDFKNRNDEWVAGFTGYISSLSPVFAPGNISTLTLSCKGWAALLQRSEIVTAQATDPANEPFRKGDFASIGYSAMANNLAGMDGDKLIGTVIGLARNIFSYNTPEAHDVTPTVVGPIRGKRPEDYFYQERLWNLAGDTYANERLQDNVGYGNGLVACNPVRDWSKTTDVAAMMGKIIVDPEIMVKERNQYKIFQQAIQTSLEMYQNKSMYAHTICQKMAEIVGYEFFEDPKGNLILQAPKYDKLPRLRDSEDVKADPANSSAFSNNYSNLPYHGRDYILDDIGLKTRRYSFTEDGVVTYVTTHAMTENIGQTITGEETLNLECAMASTSYSNVSKLSEELGEQIIRLNRRYGVRRHDTEPIISSEINNKDLLRRWALQLLIKINAGQLIGTVGMHQRPDIWMGKTVFLVEEQKLAYVVGTSNAYNRAGQQTHDTQLTLAYIHHPSELIGVPWFLATETENNLTLPSDTEKRLL